MLTRAPFMPEQDIAVLRMHGKKFFALFPDLGTGKSFMLLRDFLIHFQLGLVDGALIIAPPDVHRQWIKSEWPLTTDLPCVARAWPELPPMLPSRLPRLFTVYPAAFARKRIKGETREERKAQRDRIKARAAKGKFDGEGVWKLCQNFMQSGRMALIIDESQCLGSVSSNTTRRIRTLKPLAAYRRIASGFPAPKMIQYYPQYSLLSTTILGCTTKAQFEARYCVMGGFRNKQIVAYKNEADFNRRVAPFTYTVKIEDCVTMPERTYMVHEFEMSPEQQRLTEQIKKEFRATLADDTLTLPLVLQRITRIQQIACGFLPQLDPDTSKVIGLRWIKENRTAALEQLLNGIRGKVLIWSAFAPCIERLTKHFGPEALKYRGGMTKAEKEEAKDEFIRNPKKRFLFGQGDSLGTGTNGLTIARTAIYWSNPQSAQLRRQTERRTWRIGQKAKGCVYVDIEARGSYDRKIRKALLKQLDVATTALDDIAEWACDLL